MLTKFVLEHLKLTDIQNLYNESC